MRNKIWLLIGFIFYQMNHLMAQCVMCKAQAEAQADEDGSAINMGIIYIMIIPYVLLFFFFFRKKIFSF